ncbi:MAG: iron-sulfur cluster biosynthesis transcriptional regulator SufR [Shackletoniella antarctica]|uniref:Iron-sulfur cluster biosynthesis transcriptional regulator SufR n=1 Tax=Shackletoniella antarctica TaxID=268115 RepID=A0A2W4W2B9_9CYAN|nr:MAG: iron-sulfur cluster biosynthesis transcriptional regulator SufR [Shackletoniella antarctica]
MTSVQQPSTKDDILTYLLKRGEATAHDLAKHFEVSAQAIRRHLKDLEAEELIEHRVVQEGMGRPNHLYQVSAKGRDRFPHKYDEFALSLLNTLLETVGKDQVGTLLRKQWERKALEYRDRLGTGHLTERVARLVQLRKAEGYMSEWHEVNDGDTRQAGSGYVITEYNCAISHIAESFPSICGHELEMFQMALGDCSVERTHWLVQGEHHCGYLVQEG